MDIHLINSRHERRNINVKYVHQDKYSKKDKLQIRLASIFNVSLDNVDVFTVMPKVTVKDTFLDVRFSVHGSPYYSAEKLNTKVASHWVEVSRWWCLLRKLINLNQQHKNVIGYLGQYDGRNLSCDKKKYLLLCVILCGRKPFVYILLRRVILSLVLNLTQLKIVNALS